VQASHRTPQVPIREVFRLAAESAAGDRGRSEVVAESLGYLQRGFDAHYAAETAEDEQILIGDGSYAWAIETIARLDEPEFVAVASRLIRDGAGRISSGGPVDFGLWLPHLAGLLDIVTGEGQETSEGRVLKAEERLEPRDGSESPTLM
jgi:hypothetical protein